jgi:shikimate 5-dehydrogenase
VVGFEKSLVPLLRSQHQKALIIGTGGASKAVKYVLIYCILKVFLFPEARLMPVQ